MCTSLCVAEKDKASSTEAFTASVEEAFKQKTMSDIFFIIVAFICEFIGPVLLLGLLIWLIWGFVRIWRTKKSLNAAKGDTSALRMEHTRILAGLASFLGWAAFPVVLAAAMAMDMEPQVALISAGLCGAAALYCSHRLKYRYSLDFKEKLVRTELEKIFDNLFYKPEADIRNTPLLSQGILAPFSTISCNDLIAASYHGIDFIQCDIRIQDMEEIVTTGEDGMQQSREILTDVFRGRLMRFAQDSSARGPVQVIRYDFSADSLLQKQWQRVETELAAFEDRFRVYAEDPLAAMRIMTPQMIEAIYYLDQKLNVPLLFHFENGEMLVFIAQARDAFEVSGGKTLLEEKEQLKKDIALVTGFLDTMYFKERRTSADSEEKAEAAADRAATASGAALDAFSPSGTLSGLRAQMHGPMLLLCQAAFWLPVAVWGISVAYAFLCLPDGIALSFSFADGTAELSESCSTPAYCAIGALFVLPSAFLAGSSLALALNASLLGRGRGIGMTGRLVQTGRYLFLAICTGIPLWLHLFFISINMDYV